MAPESLTACRQKATTVNSVSDGMRPGDELRNGSARVWQRAAATRGRQTTKLWFGSFRAVDSAS